MFILSMTQPGCTERTMPACAKKCGRLAFSFLGCKPNDATTPSAFPNKGKQAHKVFKDKITSFHGTNHPFTQIFLFSTPFQCQ